MSIVQKYYWLNLSTKIKTYSFSKASLIETSYGARNIPFSVIIPVISSFGVTSNAGFKNLIPSAQTVLPLICETSSCERSSIGISLPDLMFLSIVESGAAI